MSRCKLTRIVLFRHGETNWNKDGRIQGYANIPLNNNGTRQAEALATSLAQIAIDLIISSDLTRAHDTAQIVALRQNKTTPILLREGLRELNYGIGDGQKKEVVRQEYKHILQIINDWNHPETDTVYLPSGESRGNLVSRLLDEINETLNNYPDIKVLAVSTHGFALSSLYKHIFNERKEFENCEFLELQSNQIIK